MLKNVKVKELLSKHLDKTVKKIEVTTERIITEIAACALIDPADLLDDNGELLPIKQMPENARRAISELTIATDKDGRTIYKIKLVSKDGALDKLARIMNMYSEETQTDLHKVYMKNYRGRKPGENKKIDK